jgi:hypothetical protein
MHAFPAKSHSWKALNLLHVEISQTQNSLLLHYGRTVPSMTMKDQYAGRVLFIMKP